MLFAPFAPMSFSLMSKCVTLQFGFCQIHTHIAVTAAVTDDKHHACSDPYLESLSNTCRTTV